METIRKVEISLASEEMMALDYNLRITLRNSGVKESKLDYAILNIFDDLIVGGIEINEVLD